MSTNFTEKQREVVARKMGYDGPMQMFDEYLASSPSDANRFAGITSKVAAKMARGGLVKRYAAGGVVTEDEVRAAYAANPKAEQNPSQSSLDYWTNKGLGTFGAEVDAYREANPNAAASIDAAKKTTTAAPTEAPTAAPTRSADNTSSTGQQSLVDFGDASVKFTGGVAGPTKDNPYTAEQQTKIKNMVASGKVDAATGVTTYDPQETAIRAAYAANPKAEKNPSQASIDYWKAKGLDTFDAEVNKVRTDNPRLATAIDAARADTKAPTSKSGLTDADVLAAYYANPNAEKNPTQKSLDYWKEKGLSNFNAEVDAVNAASKTTAGEGVPVAPTATTAIAEKSTAPPDIKVTDQAVTTDAKTTDVKAAVDIAAPSTITAETITPDKSQAAVQAELDKFKAEQGTVSEKAKITAETGTVSEAAKAVAQKAATQAAVVAGTRTTGEGELITPVTDAVAVKAGTEQTAAPEKVIAAQREVAANELVQAAQIKEADMAQAEAIVSAGLSKDATAVAKRLEAFTVDTGTLAAAQQGDVTAQGTVQGQLTELMKSFDDGATPAWAAGALRAANAALSARGLGASSMASVAIFQAAMESALPIASQDAKTYADMGLSNLNNRQQTALANAAAQQGLALQNLSNEQQAMLANSTNSFALQSQNLSNMQQTMLANTQIKAAFQGQNLTNQQQAAVVNAARYAEQANINLNNVQQAALHNSSMQVQVDISNTSNRQQTSLANAQIEAALQGKILDNRQQAAVLNATRVAENANLTFTAAQTAALQNSNVMKDISIADLSAAQSTVLANAATAATMDMANLNNRQQAAVMNAKSFLEMDMKNLDLAQQTAIIKTQQISQTILSDTAAANAAKATNASNAIEVDRINETLKLTASQFNAAETNKISTVNANAANELSKFNASEANNRAEFNANNATTINVANAKILADISTSNTVSANNLAAVNAKNATDLSATVYAQQSTTYRDLLQMSATSGENNLNRITNLAIATMTSNATTANANIAADAASSAAIGAGGIKLIEVAASTAGQSALKAGYETLKGWLTKS